MTARDEDGALAHVLLVDDHPLFRDGFAHMVRTCRPAWRLDCAEDSSEALAILQRMSFDVIIVDIGLQGEDGFTLLETIARERRATRRILISGREDLAVRVRARAGDAHGFIVKTTRPDVFVQTIDRVLAGEEAFEPTIASGVLPTLSVRQTEVLMLVAEGLGNKEIRYRLNIAERTVRAHLTDLYKQLDAHSRTQALVRARALGLIA